MARGYASAPAFRPALSVPRVTLVGMSDPPSMRDLADRLFAAADDAAAYHHDLCRQHPGDDCSCGAPRLLADVAAVLEKLGLVRRDVGLS